MKKFILVPPDRREIEVLDTVPLVRIALGEAVLCKNIKKRVFVAKGELLAEHSSPNIGDTHAPVAGVIKDITTSYIEIETASQPETEHTGNPPVPVCFDGLDLQQLSTALKKLGIAVRPFTRPCDLFIINALNPEPGMYYTQELLSSYLPVLTAGLALLARLNGGKTPVLAVPTGSSLALPGVSCHGVPAEYPNSLARPLIRIITGKEHTSNVTMVRLHMLFALGLVATSGLPLTEAVLTVQGKNFLVPLGTPASMLFSLVGVSPANGDTLIMGGLMRGQAMASTDIGVDKNSEALYLIRKGSLPSLEDNPCIACGACVQVCPMRLRPNMLSRYAEFERYESCRGEDIELCIECGLCGYVCPSCRPMQQYFRMAKFHLGVASLQHQMAKQQ